jgi:hypothetical protein
MFCFELKGKSSGSSSLRFVAGANAWAAGIGGACPAEGASACNFAILQPWIVLK